MEDRTSKYKMVGAIDTTITGKYLYMLLCDLAGSRGRIQIPVRKLREITGISSSSIRRNLHRLEVKGLLKIRPVHEPDGTQKANLYIID